MKVVKQLKHWFTLCMNKYWYTGFISKTITRKVTSYFQLWILYLKFNILKISRYSILWNGTSETYV